MILNRHCTKSTINDRPNIPKKYVKHARMRTIGRQPTTNSGDATLPMAPSESRCATPSCAATRCRACCANARLAATRRCSTALFSASGSGSASGNVDQLSVGGHGDYTQSVERGRSFWLLPTALQARRWQQICKTLAKNGVSSQPRLGRHHYGCSSFWATVGVLAPRLPRQPAAPARAPPSPSRTHARRSCSDTSHLSQHVALDRSSLRAGAPCHAAADVS